MMKKKYLAVMLSLCMALSLCGCGDGKDAPADNNVAVQTEEDVTVEEETATAEDETGEAASEDEDDDSPKFSDFDIPELSIQAKDIPNSEAMQFVYDMKVGWNLGNTLDSTAAVTGGNELSTETSWVGVETSQQLIDDLAAAGFKTIRVPITWHTHVDENYQISPIWLDRVEEIVNYCLNDDLYVIINIHHDFDTQYIYPRPEYLDNSLLYVRTIWEQLADRFGDYDNHIIFESLNEPRMVGDTYEWWINPQDQSCKDAIACINDFNQAFVDVVRSSDKENNKNRYLMVPGYDASPDGALNGGFKLPEDTADNRLIVSVHAYTPYDFALNTSGTDYFSYKADFSTRDIDDFMNRLYNTFISKGIPVVIGEFGAVNKDNNTQQRVEYAAYYTAFARSRGITACWWDNNNINGGGEQFGLYYRRGGYFIYSDIVKAMMQYCQ